MASDGDEIQLIQSMALSGSKRALLKKWMQAAQNDPVAVLEAYGRLNLADFAITHIQSHAPGRALRDLETSKIQRWLLAIYRLSQASSNFLLAAVVPSELLFGLNHESPVVRYLTVRIMCLYLKASNTAAEEDLIQTYVGEDAILGDWEDKAIDYRFLSLWEAERIRQLKKLQESSDDEALSFVLDSDFSKRYESDKEELGNHYDPTLRTSRTNLVNFFKALLAESSSNQPVLLMGSAGSGKSSLVHFVAQRLDKSMISLHLNEQSDGKALLGLYTSGTNPGTFEWRPGVLTTAVREGRWVLIEDLDRAPNEIISTILPLIERNELYIPGRGETVRAAQGFKIIATIRTGPQLLNRQILGLRLWRQVQVQGLDDDELLSLIAKKYAHWISRHPDMFVNIYSHVRDLTQSSSFTTLSRTTHRALTVRDLLKWCNRVANAFGSREELSDADYDIIFLEAVDCFAGHISQGDAFDRLVSMIASDLGIDPQRYNHILTSRQIKLAAYDRGIQVGRVLLSFSSSTKKPKLSPTFSANPHTLRLLEKVASAIKGSEPLLLIGETGTGKTTSLQALANLMGKRLVPFNLSQQSESSDLLGGFKPVNVETIVMPLQEEFEHLFSSAFSQKGNDNSDFLGLLHKCLKGKKWKRVCKLWRAAISEIQRQQTSEDAPQSKRQKLENGTQNRHMLQRWQELSNEISDLESRLHSSEDAVSFAFVEGKIVKAIRNGDWVLLDEINLASPDTLEALADLFPGDNTTPSLLLTEAGKIERVAAHPDFRIFAAMNPATDVGKRDLPPSIRSRFTELHVEGPDKDIKSLRHIIQSYLGDNVLDKALVANIADFYLKVQELSESNSLVDGSGQKPHFSLRSLTRCLTFAKDVAPLSSLRRGIYEGFHMSFSTHLDKASDLLLAPLAVRYIFGKKSHVESELGRPLQMPKDGKSYIRHGQFWIRQGQFTPQEQPQYIITPFVERNLDNLVRAAFSRRYPVLIQGPTSAGKTSMIEYLAKRSGNKFVRVNNHEHTDLQEYLGSYVSDSNGKLHFQEGILVEALRNGYWIVLDELNLAPSDILEALNRLLDDNRELFIPETKETIRPHEDFMLFATQNPAGLYGGRKPLSRAFRNRFLELHFDDIPVDELCEILHRRTKIPESYSRQMVEVYKELSKIRQESRIFEQKSFATLRDLFRWALRKADDYQQLAINGYMLLAERVRKDEERLLVKDVIEKVMSKKLKVRFNLDYLYSAESCPEISIFKSRNPTSGVVWTQSMRRLFVLVSHALRNNEPVLLVGETGCGKTTVVQMLAHTFGKHLSIVNAHQNTDTGDLIGSQRPIRNRALIEAQLREMLSKLLPKDENQTLSSLLEQFDLVRQQKPDKFSLQIVSQINELRTRMSALFQWCDGSLVTAMKDGSFFLLDEISLAEDSVLERLNSVLEPERTIFLAEKTESNAAVNAISGFQFLATMNPGGDYGKRELSPALRNRFTEIWVPAIRDVNEIGEIVQAKLMDSRKHLSTPIVKFSEWFARIFNTSATSSISIRDVSSCVEFVNSSNLDHSNALLHGIAMVYIDTLGANPAGLLSISTSSLSEQRRQCIQELENITHHALCDSYFFVPKVELLRSCLSIGPFSIPRTFTDKQIGFSFQAPTTRSNAMRIIRALSLSKPILIEGDPGVGKTTLVSTLSKLIGKRLVRMNLSEQTDLMDLFGSDVPVDGVTAGTFAWRDAPFLTAMKKGDWVLLDEMNLASQSVLEGLNACLDHRGEAFIAELDQTFRKHPNFRLFAAQNPHHQGGGRKGLPASFVNRFTVVYADPFAPEDLSLVCQTLYPSVPKPLIEDMTNFVRHLDVEVRQRRSLGSLGSPWEINLRDMLRFLEICSSSIGLMRTPTSREIFELIFQRRFRSLDDRLAAEKFWVEHVHDNKVPQFDLTLTATTYQVGMALMKRNPVSSPTPNLEGVPRHLLPVLQDLILCVERNWPVILVGPSGSGKTALLYHLAAAKGARLSILSMNSEIDAMDLVGGFEQAEPSRHIFGFAQEVQLLMEAFTLQALRSPKEVEMSQVLSALDLLQRCSGSLSAIQDAVPTIVEFLEKVSTLQDVSALIEAANVISGIPDISDKASFEWVDGILVKAIQKGDWLILDNANLCSSSVLDRLNSLLEPNGVLIVNERPLPDGTARLIERHPDFRVFLTMDPRYGELSNAMRNRSVELFCELREEADEFKAGELLEASTHRFAQVLRTMKEAPTSIRDHLPDFNDRILLSTPLSLIALDHLLTADLRKSDQFRGELRSGLAVREVGEDDTALQCLLSLRSEKSLLRVWPNNQEHLMSIHPMGKYLPEVLDIKTTKWYGALIEIVRDCFTTALYAKTNDFSQVRWTMVDDEFEMSVEHLGGGKVLRSAEFQVEYQTYVGRSILNTSRVVQELFKQAPSDSNMDILTPLERLTSFRLFLGHPRFANRCFLNSSISVAQDLFESEMHSAKLSNFLNQEVELLGKCFHIEDRTSGKHMEQLWNLLRPLLPRSAGAFTAMNDLELLVDELDHLLQNVWIDSRTAADVISAFQKAWALVREGATSTEMLFSSLKRSIESIKLDESRVMYPHGGFFRQEFNWLMQFLYLSIAAGDGQHKAFDGTLLEALTRSEVSVKKIILGQDKAISRPFSVLHHLLVYSELSESASHHNDQIYGLLGRLNDINDVSLRELVSVRQDLVLLGRLLATENGLLREDHRNQLNTVYNWLVSQLSEFKYQTRNELSNERVIWKAFQGASNEEVGIGWIRLALWLIQSYIPDQPIDPLLKEYYEAQLQAFHISYLQFKHLLLESDEWLSTGMKSNTRSNLFGDKIASLLALPSKSFQETFQRPGPNLCDGIQEQFDHILRLAKTVKERLERNQLEFKTTMSNLSRIAETLQQNFQGYDDIIEPTLGILHMMMIGISLTQQSQIHQAKMNSNWLFSFFSPQSFKNTSSYANYLSALKSWTIKRQTESCLSAHDLRQVRHAFSEIWSQWKSKIRQAQVENEKSSSLYTFRGAQDDATSDDEREFDELFPDFKEESPEKLDIVVGHENAVEVCDLHEGFVLGKESAQDAILHMAQSSSQIEHGTKDLSSLLVIVYLRTKNRLIELNQTSKGHLYNFYQDRNLEETHRMLGVVNRIQHRFRTLQQSWPEHATIENTLQISEEIFDFKQTDPVARFLPKCEKLHETVYEWQTVASKEYTAVQEYDELTKLLISWRRLELNTWTRLFDIEMQKCQEGAKSWWYMAYEVIFETPKAIHHSKESLQEYVLNMVRELKHFMETTTLGQYDSRLHLLSTFTLDIKLELEHTPRLIGIYNALSNLLAYYERFQKPAKDFIQAERAKLEKGVKEVVQLASWKDTNINALRDSAKASHRKLFKFVRKFRTLLSKPVKSIVERETPDITNFVDINCNGQSFVKPAKITVSNLGNTLPGWSTFPTRYQDIHATVGIMSNLFGTSNTFTSPQWIKGFLSDLENSKALLRKETPKTLTDENKMVVTHLKTRKRMLFADVLKEARRMGLQHNLSSVTLAKQDSFARILCEMNTPQNASVVFKDAEYHLHKIFSILSPLRDLKQEHSGDLTPAEITRSSGYLEALLQRILIQRKSLVSGLGALEQIQKVFQALNHLRAYKDYELSANIRPLSHALSSMKIVLSQSSPVLSVVSATLSAQAHLGGFDSSIIQSKLQAWIARFETLRSRFQDLDTIPFPISSSLHARLFNDVKLALSDFMTDLKAWMSENSTLVPALEQLLPIGNVKFASNHPKMEVDFYPFENFQQDLFRCLDTMLSSIETLSRFRTLPNPQKDLAWMIKEEAAHIAGVNALRMPKITDLVMQTLQKLPHLSPHEISNAFVLLDLVDPILLQYQDICISSCTHFESFQASVCKVTFQLAKSFLEIGKNGFCTPQEAAGGANEGAEKLEGGTGLGNGEGAENISKDIGEDEDLTELAEEPNEEREDRDNGDDQDAVDMADADLEGELEELENQEKEGEDEGQDQDGEEEEIDEEVGDVDDLGENALDEKMWDSGEKTGKEKENKEGKGSRDEEQITAENDAGEGDEPDAGEQQFEDEPDNVESGQPEMTDPYLDDGNNLDLPEDMNIDRQNDAKSDSLEDLSDLGDMDEVDDGVDGDADSMPEDPMDNIKSELEKPTEQMDQKSSEAVDEHVTEEIGEDEAQEDEQNTLTAENQDETVDSTKSEAQKGKGYSADDSEAVQGGDNVEETASDESNDASFEHRNSSGKQGKEDDAEEKTAVGRAEKLQSAATEAFKELGNVLEKWYNQNRDIQKPLEEHGDETENMDVDMKDVDFEHLENENDKSIAQALGTAEKEQAMGLNNENEMHEDFDDIDNSNHQEVSTEEQEVQNQGKSQGNDPEPGGAKSIQGHSIRHEDDEKDEVMDTDLTFSNDLDVDISSIYINRDTSSRNLEQSRALWIKAESSTRVLAATLAEQLRLILVPTLATKLRGDFRTGKRLNIKRIIPYIASSYKKDKIWMRRSVPSKRNYQIMIALDDSKSMADKQDDGIKKVDLAFQTLALIAKSLSILETGELSIIGFGQEVMVAHPFGQPFTDEAGGRVFDAFHFDQGQTDVKKLVHQAIDMFQTARATAKGSFSDLWQLLLIVSDGMCSDHESIVKLVRKAQEEKIMIVFVIVDDSKKGIMGLETPEFVGDGGVLWKKYMDSFPFSWWIVVKDVRDLPNVLSGALKQWFAEVVESS